MNVKTRLERLEKEFWGGQAACAPERARCTRNLGEHFRCLIILYRDVFPATAETPRETIRGGSLVGGREVEATPWRSTFLDIKEGTGDRVVLEYDLRDQAVTKLAVLRIELAKLDIPDFTSIFVYSFAGNGLANARDFFRTDNFATVFTDFGQASNFIPPYHILFSLEMTATYNQAIANGHDYLGVLFKNTVAEPQYALYRLTTFNGFPKLTVGVPEPSSFCLAFFGAALGCIHRRFSRRPLPRRARCCFGTRGRHKKSGDCQPFTSALH